jgi:hypothetical protein
VWPVYHEGGLIQEVSHLTGHWARGQVLRLLPWQICASCVGEFWRQGVGRFWRQLRGRVLGAGFGAGESLGS